jgi:hypothetical protein
MGAVPEEHYIKITRVSIFAERVGACYVRIREYYVNKRI